MWCGRDRHGYAWAAAAAFLVACALGWIWLGSPAVVAQRRDAAAGRETPAEASRDTSKDQTSEQVDAGESSRDGTATPPVSSALGDEVVECLEALTGAGTQGRTWLEAGSVEPVATHLLTAYRDGEPCVLAQAGYLDLVGATWGCVVQGGAWVDVCVVSEQESVCQVLVVRYDRDAVAEELADEDRHDTQEGSDFEKEELGGA